MEIEKLKMALAEAEERAAQEHAHCKIEYDKRLAAESRCAEANAKYEDLKKWHQEIVASVSRASDERARAAEAKSAALAAALAEIRDHCDPAGLNGSAEIARRALASAAPMIGRKEDA